MSEIEIKPGQRWRRKKDGRATVILRRHGAEGWDDWWVRWEDGTAARVIFGYNIRRFYEPIEEQEA